MKALIAAALLSLPALSALAEPREVSWPDLSAPTKAYDNPFAKLKSDQMNRLARLLQLQGLTGDTEAAEEATTLKADLQAEGLDVDWLFAERTRIIKHRTQEARDPNPGVVGQSVRLPGYVLPLDLNEESTTEFLLVPTVGACIHTPPPPANQIVHVSFPEGFALDGLYTPVWISGELRAKPQTKSIFMVDGTTNVSVTYSMKASTVEAYN